MASLIQSSSCSGRTSRRGYEGPRRDDSAVREAEVRQLCVADRGVGSGHCDDSLGDRVQEGTHQVAPRPRRTTARSARGRRGGRCAARRALSARRRARLDQAVVVDEAVLEHGPHQSGLGQHRAVPLKAGHSGGRTGAVGRHRAAVDHQHRRGRGAAGREVEVEAPRRRLDGLVREHEGPQVRRGVGHGSIRPRRPATCHRNKAA